LFLFSFTVSVTADHISNLQRERTYSLRVSMIYLPSVLVLLIDQTEKEFSIVRHIFLVLTQLFPTFHWFLCLLLEVQSTVTQNTQHIDIIFLVFSWILKMSKIIFGESYEPCYVTIFEQFFRKCISNWSFARLRFEIYG
jgi:hypothetical protein